MPLEPEIQQALLKEARVWAPTVDEVVSVNPARYMGFEDPFFLHQLESLWEAGSTIEPIESRITAVGQRFAYLVMVGLLLMALPGKLSRAVLVATL